ncbi:MAG: L-2-hydroxyglutarate oxidase [Nitrospirota bacterium]|nr:L-2-hydroxyglutarate oxidase [Nitrospirota bacterium]
MVTGTKKTDFLVIGGGVIGLNIARDLRRRYGDSSVTLIEKESDCGLHASGRNSGVLHAGFYYAPKSLKAAFTRNGNQELTAYCEAKGLPINRCGKIVVARNQRDHPALDELLRRGHANGIAIQDISEADAKAIEPRVKTCERALFSPTTSTVDPRRVVEAMKADALREGVTIECGVQYVGRRGTSIETTTGVYQAGYVVNAAGLYADRIARDFGFSERYRILPFKGLYLYSNQHPGFLRTNIYPVPDLANPFLGVHFTVTVDGHAKIGPTAIPALWREQYQGYRGFKLGECAEILIRMCGLMALSSFDFKRLAIRELAKYSRARLVAQAGALLEGVQLKHFQTWGPPGIRAQLLDLKQRTLEMDFILEGDRKSMHVLNAVSPAFTCSLPFSRYVGERIGSFLK